EAAVGAADDEIEISEEELRLAMQHDPKAMKLEGDKLRIANHIEATRRSLKPGAKGPSLSQYEADLANVKEKLASREQELRPELIERRRQVAAAAIGSLRGRITQLTYLEKQYLKKSRELEGELKNQKPANEIDDLQHEIANYDQILNGLRIELQQ